MSFAGDSWEGLALKSLSLSELRLAYERQEITFEDLLELLKTDTRKGFMSLVASISEQRKKERQRIEQYHRMLEAEQTLRDKGFLLVAGLDEVGRGPLAGPVVTAAVILDPDRPIYGLRDSKKLTKHQRTELAEEIRDKAICISLHEHSNDVIDRINILEATKDSMLQALNQMTVQPQHLLIDALRLDCSLPQTGIIGGDDRCLCIAAASIVAKVYRDQRMVEYHAIYPVYGFDRHVGYGSREHLEAIRTYGPSPIHRRSFLRNILQGNPSQ